MSSDQIGRVLDVRHANACVNRQMLYRQGKGKFHLRTGHEGLACLACLLTRLLTQWTRVLLEKLAGFQLVKKFPAFYGTPRFITAVTCARHLSLS